MKEKANGTYEHPVFGELIHAYTRAEAIADGVLVEVDGGLARQIGFRMPIALTYAAWASCIPVPDHLKHRTDETEESRMADLLRTLRFEIRHRTACGQDRVHFQIAQEQPDGTREYLKLKAICGPGDDPRAVLTVLLPDED